MALTLIHRDSLLPHEYRRILQQLGGGYSVLDALWNGPVGSPPLHYLSGHADIDALDARSTNALRINLERLKQGLILWISERTQSYFFALPTGEYFIESGSTDSDGSLLVTIHFGDQHALFRVDRERRTGWEGFMRGV